jgi:hypothetical protein
MYGKFSLTLVQLLKQNLFTETFVLCVTGIYYIQTVWSQISKMTLSLYSGLDFPTNLRLKPKTLFFLIMYIFQLPTRTPPPLCRLARPPGWGFEYSVTVTGHGLSLLLLYVLHIDRISIADRIIHNEWHIRNLALYTVIGYVRHISCQRPYYS